MPRSAKHLRGEVKPSKFKTSMCQYFIKDSECPFGDKCAFAHGDAELRSEQQNISDLATPPLEPSRDPQQQHDTSYHKTICSEMLFLPHSNGSSGRDLATPPGVASLSHNEAVNQRTPREECLNCSTTSSYAGPEISVAVFQHNPYSPAGRSTSRKTMQKETMQF
jgi:hypothetical protein